MTAGSALSIYVGNVLLAGVDERDDVLRA